jgi:hypothetical protein
MLSAVITGLWVAAGAAYLLWQWWSGELAKGG